jgi:hypothetical protein
MSRLEMMHACGGGGCAQREQKAQAQNKSHRIDSIAATFTPVMCAPTAAAPSRCGFTVHHIRGIMAALRARGVIRDPSSSACAASEAFSGWTVRRKATQIDPSKTSRT